MRTIETIQARNNLYSIIEKAKAVINIGYDPVCWYNFLKLRQSAESVYNDEKAIAISIEQISMHFEYTLKELFKPCARSIVYFEDDNLKRVILQQLGLVGEITEQQLQKLESLKIVNSNIFSLRGLEKAGNLRYLNAAYNNISNIEPVAVLLQLEYLNVAHNAIDSLPELDELNHLHTFRIEGNAVVA
ncbi:MAG: leucine-rich repeat domain-containing protein [Bacilli bacterium]